jgi:hypothetical protein
VRVRRERGLAQILGSSHLPGVDRETLRAWEGLGLAVLISLGPCHGVFLPVFSSKF